MSPEEALEIIDKALAQVNAPRAIHSTLQQAVMILHRVVAQKQSRPVAVPQPVGEPEAANGG